MEIELGAELLKKAAKAASPEELLALAKEDGLDLPREEVEKLYAKLHKSGELSDEELDNVSGGGCGDSGGGVRYMDHQCPRCHRAMIKVCDTKTQTVRYYCKRCDLYD